MSDVPHMGKLQHNVLLFANRVDYFPITPSLSSHCNWKPLLLLLPSSFNSSFSITRESRRNINDERWISVARNAELAAKRPRTEHCAALWFRYPLYGNSFPDERKPPCPFVGSNYSVYPLRRKNPQEKSAASYVDRRRECLSTQRKTDHFASKLAHRSPF